MTVQQFSERRPAAHLSPLDLHCFYSLLSCKQLLWIQLHHFSVVMETSECNIYFCTNKSCAGLCIRFLQHPHDPTEENAPTYDYNITFLFRISLGVEPMTLELQAAHTLKTLNIRIETVR